MRYTALLAPCLLLFAPAVLAQPVDLTTARLAGWAWAVRGGTLGVELGHRVERATSHVTERGGTFYSVKLKGGGTVFLSSDDTCEPVVAFIDGDCADLGADDPLWAMLARSAENVDNVKLSTSSAVNLNLPPQPQRQRWAKLIAEGKEIEANGVPKMEPSYSTIDDMRVPRIVMTDWGQGSGIWNYYTPKHHVCGCVTTAQSQIMRYHRWPMDPVEAKTFTCEVDGVKTNITMFGGTYDWEMMPLQCATNKCEIEEQKQAIGKLTHDVSASLLTIWDSSGGAAKLNNSNQSFLQDFGYANGVHNYYPEWTFSLTNAPATRFAAISRTIYANFDAGLPVMLGIPQHAILGDGYGYVGDVDYVHVNYGWGGNRNIWYHIPSLYVQGLVYNIFPTNSNASAVMSGRVTDYLGRGVGGARVRVKDGSGTVVRETTTRTSGTWGVVVATNTYDIEVLPVPTRNCAGGELKGVVLTSPVVTKKNNIVDENDVDSFGNSYGNDLQLEAANPDYPEVPNYGATFENHTVGDTRVIDEDDNGKIAKESYDGKFWWAQDGVGAVIGNYASFTGIVYRAIHNTYDVTNVAAKTVGEFVPEEIGNEGFVFDARVRLEDAQDIQDGQDVLLPDDDIKIAVMAQGGKLVVIAGDGMNDRSTKVYETGRTIDTRVMHRVTIQASEREIFRVWFDGKRIPGIFPSRILGEGEGGKVRAMGFAGVGIDVDDVYTTREMPFALPGMMFIMR